VGEKGKLYGSVTSAEIAKALAEKGKRARQLALLPYLIT
jgi:ribosomal protein S18